MDDEVRDRVFHLVVLHAAVVREKLTPETTLARDLGIEPDVAEGFFADFSKEFGVPLVPADWSGYFYSPSVGCGPVLLAFVPAAVLAGLLKIFAGVRLWFSSLLGFVLTLVVLYVRYKPRPRPQISIQDLIDCANSREWKKPPAPR